MTRSARNNLLLSSLVVVAALVGLAACQGKGSGDSATPAVERLTVDALVPVLGKAEDANSGVLDVSGDTQNMIVTYRYYDLDLKNYDEDMVKELTPKIEALYKKFEILDRVEFHVITNNPLTIGEWKPFMNFALTRKIVREIEWSRILAQDFFKNIIELKRFN